MRNRHKSIGIGIGAAPGRANSKSESRIEKSASNRFESASPGKDSTWAGGAGTRSDFEPVLYFVASHIPPAHIVSLKL